MVQVEWGSGVGGQVEWVVEGVRGRGGVGGSEGRW